jgi:hypothetical protein
MSVFCCVSFLLLQITSLYPVGCNFVVCVCIGLLYVTIKGCLLSTWLITNFHVYLLENLFLERGSCSAIDIKGHFILDKNFLSYMALNARVVTELKVVIPIISCV